MGFLLPRCPIFFQPQALVSTFYVFLSKNLFFESRKNTFCGGGFCWLRFSLSRRQVFSFPYNNPTFINWSILVTCSHPDPQPGKQLLRPFLHYLDNRRGPNNQIHHDSNSCPWQRPGSSSLRRLSTSQQKQLCHSRWVLWLSLAVVCLHYVIDSFQAVELYPELKNLLKASLVPYLSPLTFYLPSSLNTRLLNTIWSSRSYPSFIMRIS